MAADLVSVFLLGITSVKQEQVVWVKEVTIQDMRHNNLVSGSVLTGSILDSTACRVLNKAFLSSA